MSYETDIEIDESALDVEWVEHPRRMLKYCEMSARANREMALAKEALDVVRAQLDQKVRSDPDSYGVVAGPRGITEGGITAAILVHPEYEVANRRCLDARYECDIATGVVHAFDHRKTALENLVRLHGQSYFAGPAIPRNLAEERRAKDARVQGRIKIQRRA